MDLYVMQWMIGEASNPEHLTISDGAQYLGIPIYRMRMNLRGSRRPLCIHKDRGVDIAVLIATTIGIAIRIAATCEEILQFSIASRFCYAQN